MTRMAGVGGVFCRAERWDASGTRRLLIRSAVLLLWCAAAGCAGPREEVRSAPAQTPDAVPAVAALGPVCSRLAACCARLSSADGKAACDFTVEQRDDALCAPTVETFRSWCP